MQEKTNMIKVCLSRVSGGDPEIIETGFGKQMSFPRKRG